MTTERISRHDLVVPAKPAQERDQSLRLDVESVNSLPFNLRKPTVARCRVFWQLFLRTWNRLGEIHVALTTAPNDEERWRRLWHFDDSGRPISYPWRERSR